METISLKDYEPSGAGVLGESYISCSNPNIFLKLYSREREQLGLDDIDCIVHQLEDYREREDIFFKVSMFLSTHQDEIETVSTDTLMMVISYLVDDQTSILEFANDSKERVFTSSMEAMQNLDNIQFYDNVQNCYQTRCALLTKMEKDFSFKRPVSADSYFQSIKEMGNDALGINGWLTEKALRMLARQAVQNQGVPYFFYKYFSRDRVYQETINYLAGMNQENKILMEISDDDMDDYIRNNVDKTKPATPKLVAGRWENQHDTKWQTYDMQKDLTVSMTNQTEINVTFFVEDEGVNVSVLAPVVYTIEGQWQLEGDSLRMNFNPETISITSFDLDLSNIPQSALDRKQDSLDAMKQQFRSAILQQIKGTRWNLSYKVSIAKTETSMFWENQYALSWGQIETYKEQLVKIR